MQPIPETDYNSEIGVLQALIQENPMPIGLYIGREMRIRIANKAIHEAWGKTDSVIGKTFTEAIPEVKDQPFPKLLDEVYTTGIAYEATEDRVDLIVGGKLQTFYYEFTYKPLKDNTGKVWGVLNTATNVTELVLARKQFEESEKRFRQLVLQAPVALCVLKGADFIVDIVNEKMLEIWGRNYDQVINKPVFEGLPDAREQGLEQLLTHVYETGETYQAHEHPVYLFRNGKKEAVYQDFVYEPYRDGNGNIIGVIATSSNVTQQVLARKELERNQAELLEVKKRLELELDAGKQLQQQKDDFIGIASHELKTPLTALKGSMQLLNKWAKEDSCSPKIQNLINLSNSSINKLSHLLEELLNDTRISEGQLELNKSTFTMADAITECCIHVRTAGEHKITEKGDLDLEVYADRQRIEQVIINLINNAVKYAPQSKEIIITVEKKEQEAKVSIIDKGPGIPPSKLPHLFKRYYRVDTSGIQYSGLGLGLFIVSEIIRRHNGHVGVESEPGKGSTFWFSIPI